MLANIVLMGVLALAAPAAGQDTPKPEDVAVARIQADRIIAEAEAEGVFENITEDALPRLKHVQSGMTCIFDPGATRNNVHIFPVSATAPERGQNVSCGTNFGGAAVTTYASRLMPMPTVEDDMRSTIASVRETWPDAQALEGEFPVTTVDGQPESAFAALKFRHSSGQDAASFAMIRHVGEWSFKIRSTGLASDARSLAMISDLIFNQGIPGTDPAVGSGASREPAPQ